LRILTDKFAIFETFLKHQRKTEYFFEYNTKYLTSINGNYYFSFRYKNKSLKYSLKTKDLYFANRLKIKLIQRLKQKKEFKNMFDTLDDNIECGYNHNSIDLDEFIRVEQRYQLKEQIRKQKSKDYDAMRITTSIDTQEDPEVIKKIEQKILKMLITEKNRGNIKEIHMNNQSIDAENLKDGFENFLQYKKDENISQASLKSYNTFFRYLLLFTNENEKIFHLDEYFFKDMQDKVRKLPKDCLRGRNQHLKYNEIMKNFKDKKFETLSNKYINSMFNFYKNLWKYFNYKSFTKEKPLEDILTLKETTRHYVPFDIVELQVLLRENTAYDPDQVDYVKMGIYTGMRIDEIINLKKENIDLKEKLITITKSKTKSGLRVIPIHKNLFDIIENRYKNAINDFLFSSDGNKDKMTKRISKCVRKFISEPSKRFHSTRKNFAQELYFHQQQNLIQENTIQRLLGHSNKDNISFSVYNLSKIDIDVLRKAIDLIDYKI
jgi:integrase